MQLEQAYLLAHNKQIYLIPELVDTTPGAGILTRGGPLSAGILAGTEPLYIISVEDSGFPKIGKWVDCSEVPNGETVVAITIFMVKCPNPVFYAGRRLGSR